MCRVALPIFIAACALLLCPAMSAQTTSLPLVVTPSLSVNPSTEIFGGGVVELGQQVRLVWLFNDPGQLQTYQWRKNGTNLPGATAATYVIDAVAATDAGTYSVVITTATSTSGLSTDLTVKSLAIPVITSEPRPSAVHVGEFATISVLATGSYPRTYQWRKDGQNIAGATDPSYTIAATTTSDAGAYSVVITNSQGTAMSANAALTVAPAVLPVISSGYPLDTTCTQGQGVRLFIYLSGGSSPLTFQWKKNGAPIAGATNSAYDIEAAAFSDAGTYSVVVSNPAGTVTRGCHEPAARKLWSMRQTKASQ